MPVICFLTCLIDNFGWGWQWELVWVSVNREHALWCFAPWCQVKKDTHALSGIIRWSKWALLKTDGITQGQFCWSLWRSILHRLFNFFHGDHDPSTIKMLKWHNYEPWTTCSQGGNHKLKTIPRNVSGARPKKRWQTLVQYCNHANNVRIVNSHWLMRVTDVGKNHLVYQFQLILCLQRVVTERVTTLIQVCD